MDKENKDMATTSKGLRTLLIGVLVMAAGFILMMGGGSKDPQVFNWAMFDFRRLVAAPLVILCGIAIEIIAIMKRPKAGPEGKEEEMMDWLQALLLGLVQGLTEFLPVSSSGHLTIFKALLGVDAEGYLDFAVTVHLATVLGTIVVFCKPDLAGFCAACSSSSTTTRPTTSPRSSCR